MSIFNSLGSNYVRGSAVYRLGANNASAKDQLAKYLQQRYGKSIQLTYKGREALAVILKSAGTDGFVAINGYTCYAVYQAIVAAGLKPYYLDIERGELNFTAKTLESALKKEPAIRTVVIQNTLGMPCDIQQIRKLCTAHDIFLLEDLAHSIGLTYSHGKEAGTVGDGAALSFSQDKMIDAVSGGAAVMAGLKIKRVPAARWHRFTTRLYPYTSLVIRVTTSMMVGKFLLRALKNLRMLPGPMSGQALPARTLPAWHSAAALAAYSCLNKTIAHRQKIAAIYRRTLPVNVQLKHTEEAVYLRFPLLVDNPTGLIAYLKQTHIYIGDRWYDAPIAPAALMTETNYVSGDCPNAEYVAARMVNLPTHLNINEVQAEDLARKVVQWLKLQ